jgi:hypothetical protein
MEISEQEILTVFTQWTCEVKANPEGFVETCDADPVQQAEYFIELIKQNKEKQVG